jgi:hypothetical protein
MMRERENEAHGMNPNPNIISASFYPSASYHTHQQQLRGKIILLDPLQRKQSNKKVEGTRDGERWMTCIFCELNMLANIFMRYEI